MWTDATLLNTDPYRTILLGLRDHLRSHADWVEPSVLYRYVEHAGGAPYEVARYFEHLGLIEERPHANCPTFSYFAIAGAVVEAAAFLESACGSAPDGRSGTQAGASAPDNVIVSMGNRQYRVGAGGPVVLTDRQDAVLQAFLDQPAMDNRMLVGTSKVDDAAKVLRDIRNKYPSFAAAIRVPGRKNSGGYRVAIRNG